MQILKNIRTFWFRTNEVAAPDKDYAGEHFSNFKIPDEGEEDEQLNSLINEAALKMDVYKKQLYEDGLEDGSMGLSIFDSAIEKTKTYARSVIEPIKFYAIGKVTELKTSLKKSEEENKVSQDKYLQASYFKKVLDFQFYDNPRGFSKRLGWIYLFFAFSLIIADIPLALDLISKGFQLETAVSGSDLEGGYGYEQPQEVADEGLDASQMEIADFFFHPMEVFQNNWETFLTAIGIAFCTIFIKIAYDHFFGQSETKRIIYSKKLQTEFSFSQEEIDGLKKSRLSKHVVTILILMLSLLTLIILGDFRFETFKFHLLEEVVPNQAGEITDATTTDNYIKDVGPTIKRVMIMLSFLFPVVSGVCASIGLNNLMNSLAAKKAKSNHSRAKRDWQKTVDSYEELQKKLSIWRTYLIQFLTEEQRVIWIQNENSAEVVDASTFHTEKISQRELGIQKYIMSAYYRGYDKGQMEPTNSDQYSSLYQRVAAIRNKLESKSLNQSLQTRKANPDSKSSKGNK